FKGIHQSVITARKSPPPKRGAVPMVDCQQWVQAPVGFCDKSIPVPPYFCLFGQFSYLLGVNKRQIAGQNKHRLFLPRLESSYDAAKRAKGFALVSDELYIQPLQLCYWQDLLFV
ncbi:hypothetical protein MXD63_39605, partial [Frankia sp. Cpl3]|nr:hypothetical protein [Frankia sp. Cpl3]